MLTALVALLLAAAPSTAPTTRHVDPIVTWLGQLADRDPDVRDAARENLMSLPPTRLIDLKRAVAAIGAIAPAQALALRDIVTHIYLTGAEYPRDPQGGAFMGVRMDAQMTDGIVVAMRIPGFDAYRALRDGDVIVAVLESTDPLRTYQDFSNVIRLRAAGETVHVKVQRGGRSITVPLRLSPRPADATHADQMREEQMSDADEYWEQNFAKLLEPTASS